MYRVALAGVTLVEQRQTSVAFTLKRDQHYAWVAFYYYLFNPRQSILFAASGPLRQRDKAKEILAISPEAAAGPARLKQLRDHEETADALYAKFPDLRVLRGRSGATNNPVLIDWSEPSEYSMAEAIVRT